MENPIVLEYCEMIAEKIKADGVLGEKGEMLFLSEEGFCRYCEQMIVSKEWEILRAEVMVLEKLANRYQERFNIIGSVHKAFFDYMEYLHAIGLEACYKSLAQELSRRLYSE